MKKITKAKAIKAYKVFNADWTCRSFQFELGKTYKHTGKIKICNSGFHACLQAQDCFSYYDFKSENKVAEVFIWGETDSHDEDTKVCGSNIEIVRELAWQEVLTLTNIGKDNTGHSNSGNRNSGNRNSGNRNSGNRNSGDQNSGYRNSGNRNSGDRNSGYQNSGYRNSGDQNGGYRNSGDQNSGYRNSGNWNSGNRNSGDQNSGYRNSGNWNSGDRNSGDQNSGYRNSGAFCLDDNPEILLFDKPSGIRVRDWERGEVIRILTRNLETHTWVYANSMTDVEKEANPGWDTRDGYLKRISLKEAWLNMWLNLDDESRQVFLDLPNFDREKFRIITGIDITETK